MKIIRSLNNIQGGRLVYGNINTGDTQKGITYKGKGHYEINNRSYQVAQNTHEKNILVDGTNYILLSSYTLSTPFWGEYDYLYMRGVSQTNNYSNYRPLFGGSNTEAL